MLGLLGPRRQKKGRNENCALDVLFDLELNLSKSFVCEFTNIQLSLLQLSKSTFLPYNFMVRSITVVFRFSF